MPVQSGRVIVDPTQGAFNTGARKEIEQIKREIVKPREKPVTPGDAQGFTRAISTTPDWLSSNLVMRGWTFDTTVDDSPGDKPTLQLGGGDTYFGPTEAGYYETHVILQFTVIGSPTGVLVNAHSNSINVSEFAEHWAQNTIDGRYRVAFPTSRFWSDGTTTPLGLQALISGTYSPGSLIKAYVDVWRVG